MSEILFEIKDSIAFITLNRPEKLNAFNRSMALELQDQLAGTVTKMILSGLLYLPEPAVHFVPVRIFLNSHRIVYPTLKKPLMKIIIRLSAC